MRRRLTALAALAAIAAFQPASAQERSPTPSYRLDDGQVRFETEGEGVERPVRGHFGAVSSRMRLDPRHLASARATVEVLLASLQTGESAYDEMIRHAPFLALSDHPSSRFEVLEVEGGRFVPTGRWASVQLHGRFTFHGVTRDAIVPARVQCFPARDGRPERIEVRAEHHFLWADHEVTIPERGPTRTFTGTGAKVEISLRFVRTG